MYKTTPLFGINFLASKGGLIRRILWYVEKENCQWSCDHPMGGGGGMQAKASKIVILYYYLSIFYLINYKKKLFRILKLVC